MNVSIRSAAINPATFTSFRNTLAAMVMSSLLLAACGQSVVGVDVNKAAEMQKQGALLLDVRDPDEHAEGHAPQSMNIPLGRLHTRRGELEAWRNKPVVVICRSGRRSARAVEDLNAAGFSQAFNVEGGMLAWEAAKLPVEKSEAPAAP